MIVHDIIYFLNTNVLPFINEIGAWFYVFVAFVALLESTIIIGTFVPGTVVLLFFGFTASQGEISLLWVILATSIGAIVGDFISYYIGRFGTRFIKEDKGLFKLSHVEVGKGFFHKHGGKSVLLGRFIGPIRQIIPFIAGAVKMSYIKFVYLNIIGAFLWAMSYILLGFYFGSNWKLVEKIISRVGIFFTILIIGVIIYLFHKQRVKRLDALKESVSLEKLEDDLLVESIDK